MSTTESASLRGTTTLLGATIDLLSTQELVNAAGAFMREGDHVVVANHNLHSLYLFHHDPVMREYFRRARLVHIDGMGLVVLARLLGHLEVGRQHRSTYIDLGLRLFARAEEQGWHVFYLGSRPGVAEKATRRLLKRYPRLRLKTAHGYFDSTPGSPENDVVVSAINKYSPDLLLVGMGMPRQERWVFENFDRLNARAVLCTGAMMDYYAGVVPTPPRWLGAIGLEWLARLLTEPQRLWRRYLLEPWYLLAMALRELFLRIEVKQ